MSEFSINLPPRLPNAGPAPNILTAVIPDPPRQLAQLDNGTIIRGTVQGRDPDGLLVVVTDKGALKLSTPANIPSGNTGDSRSALRRRPPAGARARGREPAGERRQRPGPTHRQRAGADDIHRSGRLRRRRRRPAQRRRRRRSRSSAACCMARSCRPRRTRWPSSSARCCPPRSAAQVASPVSCRTAATPALPAGSAGAPATAGPAGAAGSADAAPSGAPASPANEALPKALVSALQADVRAKIEALFFSAPPAKGAAAPALADAADRHARSRRTGHCASARKRWPRRSSCRSR